MSTQLKSNKKSQVAKPQQHVINVISLEVMKALPFRESVTCVAIRDSNTILFGTYEGMEFKDYACATICFLSLKPNMTPSNNFFISPAAPPSLFFPPRGFLSILFQKRCRNVSIIAPNEMTSKDEPLKQ
jgi:hypothetical protein